MDFKVRSYWLNHLINPQSDCDMDYSEHSSLPDSPNRKIANSAHLSSSPFCKIQILNHTNYSKGNLNLHLNKGNINIL